MFTVSVILQANDISNMNNDYKEVHTFVDCDMKSSQDKLKQYLLNIFLTQLLKERNGTNSNNSSNNVCNVLDGLHLH